MPSIASEVKAAMKPLPPQQQPPALPASDGAPSTFESMLDDTAQAAEPQSPPDSPSASKIASTDQSQTPAPVKDAKPAQDADAKPVAAGKAGKTDKAAKTDKTDAAADDGKTAEAKTDGDAKTETKTDAQAAVAAALTTIPDTTKPADVTPVAAAVPTAVPVTAVAADSAQAIADAAAPAAAPVPVETVTPAPAAAVIVAAKIVPQADTGKADAKGKPELAVPQADDTAGDDTKVATKTMMSNHADGKPAADAGDKPAAAPAQANDERVAADAQPAANAVPQAVAAKPVTDVAQPAAMSAQAQHAAAAAAAAPSAPAAQLAQQFTQQAVPLAGVALEIAGKALAGKNHFDIRLDPPELGRIEVRLDVARDGSVSSHVIADRKDTLDLLQRDASGLQRAFEDAGLKTSDQGMQFSLRDHSAGREQNAPAANAAHLVVEDDTPLDPLPTYSRLAGAGGGLDIRV